MKIDIYNEKGYVDIGHIMNTYKPNMLIMVGGRGIGKTYNTLSFLMEEGKKFMLVRRTDSERLFIRSSQEFNPFTKLVEREVIKPFEIDKGKYADSYYYSDDEEKNAFCYCVSLATSSKIRGLSGDKIKTLYFDEFIKDNNEKTLNDEGGGFYQLIETTNRNRELEGLDPIRIILTANSNNIFNPILDSLKLTDVFLDMRKNGQEIRFLKKLKILLCDIKKSPISEKKKNTWLYRLTEGTNFYNMAINNEYYNDISNYIGLPYPIREFKPFVDIKDIHILRHSSNRLIYITYKNRGTARHQFLKTVDFLKEYNMFMQNCLKIGCVFFENMEIASYFKDFI